MWVTNQNTILGFNGKHWTPVEGTQNGRYYKLARDVNGILHTGGIRDFGRFIADSLGKLHFVSHLPPDQKGVPDFSRILNVLADSAGNVLFLAPHWAFIWNQGRLDSVPAKEKFRKSFSTQGRIFVQSFGDGVWEVKEGKLSPVPHSHILDTLNIRGGTLLNSESGETLLLITNRQGAFLFEAGKVEKVPDYLSQSVVWNIAELKQQKIVCATESEGAVIIDPIRGKVEIVNEARGLFSETVINCGEDLEGGIWLTTAQGVSRVEYPMSLQKMPDDLKNSLLAISILKHENELLLGGIGKSYRLNSENGAATLEELPGLSDLVLSMLPYQGGVLIASAGGGVNFYKAGKIEKISDHKANCLYFSSVDSLRLYIGTDEQLTSLYRQGDKWKDEGPIPGVNHRIHHIEETAAGDLWVSFTSVTKVEFENGDRFSPQVIPLDTTQGFDPIHTEFEMLQYEGELYFGTNLGIFIFDEVTQQLVPTVRFGERFADKGYGARHLTEDLEGNIWLYDGKRAGVLRPQPDGTWQWDDLPLRRMEDQEVWTLYPDPDSLIWIGTTTQLYCYNPKVEKDYTLPFYTLIDRVTVNDTQTVFYGHYSDGNGRATHTQSKKNQLTFPIAQNNISFSYTATSYEYPERTAYSYWLEGNEQGWSNWTTESDKAYTNLSEGTYTFHARSRNLYDTLGEEAAYTFTILPPWYRTWWAYLVYLSAGIGVVFLIVKWQVHRVTFQQLKERETERQQQKAMLQATVSAQENERTRIAKDLHDEVQGTLSAIKLNIQVLDRKLNKQGLAAGQTLDMTEMLDSSIGSVREIAQNLMPSVLLKLGLTRALKEICQKFNVPNHLSIHFESASPDASVRLSSDKELAIYRVVQELLANSLKHAQASEIHLHLNFKPRQLSLNYRDNGRGFDLDAIESSSHGWGFKNMKSRISLIGGTFTVESSPGAGCHFEITVPISPDVSSPKPSTA